jgi:hypothetical protein
VYSFFSQLPALAGVGEVILPGRDEDWGGAYMDYSMICTIDKSKAIVKGKILLPVAMSNA